MNPTPPDDTGEAEKLEATATDSYARRLQVKEGIWWKRLLNVQAPYHWNLRRQRLARTLDVGCGIGRNLSVLPEGSLGVDHNPASIAVARQRGLRALTTKEWQESAERRPESFDALLLAHVVEHMPRAAAASLLENYLTFLRPGGRVFFVCPQERGFASDATHVEFTDGAALTALARAAGLEPQTWFSFPLPRPAGKVFVYNEFCLLATKPAN